MIDDSLRQRIARICGEHGIGLCYVFGSQAGEDDPDEMADLDLGVVPSGWPRSHGTLDTWLALKSAIEPLIAPRVLDLVQLDKAGCHLQHEAVDRGMLIHADDEELRVAFEDRVIRDWLDFQHVVAANYRDLRREILGGDVDTNEA